MKKDEPDLSGAFNDGFKQVPMFPNKHWWLLGLAVVLSFFTWCAHSQVTLVYTGQPMGQNIVTGTVTLAKPLAPNGTQIVSPVSYSFTGDLPVATENAWIPDGSPSPTFSFTTQNSVIVAWDIEIPFLATGETSAMISVTSSGDSYSIETYSGACQAGHTADCIPPINTSNTTPGAWSMPQAQAANMQGTLAWWTARAWTLSDELTIYQNAYMSEHWTIVAQNALLTKCRVNAGRC